MEHRIGMLRNEATSHVSAGSYYRMNCVIELMTIPVMGISS